MRKSYAPVGWRYESHRHALAARGIRTRYRADVNVPMQAPVQTEAVQQRSAQMKTARDVNRQIGEAAAVAERASVPRRPAQQTRARGPFLKATVGPGAFRATEYLEARSQTEVVKLRPFNQALGLVKGGVLAGSIEMYDAQGNPTGRSESIESLLRSDTLNAQEKQALRTEIAVQAINQVRNTRLGVSTLPKFVQDVVSSNPEFKRQLSDVERELAAERRGPAQRVATEFAKEKGAEALGVAAAIPGALFGAEAAGLGTIGEAGVEEFPSYGKDVKEYPGFGETVERFDKSPFFQTNAFIGNEEDGSLKFMGNETKHTVEDLKPETPKPSGTNVLWDGLVSSKQPSRSEKVCKEVDSLFGARKKLAEVDIGAFDRGTKAYRKGNREEVVKELSKLDAEQQKLKDRYALVQQTWRKMLMSDNQDSLFSDERGFSVFGSGGSRLAEETQKLNEVKGELAKSANQVADRRFILKRRLDRMSANVRSERYVPRDVEAIPGDPAEKG